MFRIMDKINLDILRPFDLAINVSRYDRGTGIGVKKGRPRRITKKALDIPR